MQLTQDGQRYSHRLCKFVPLVEIDKDHGVHFRTKGHIRKCTGATEKN